MERETDPAWKGEYLASLAWMYLLTVFVQLEWNPIEWSLSARILVVVLSIGLIFLAIGVNRHPKETSPD